MENIELTKEIFRLLQKCLGVEIPEWVQNWIFLLIGIIVLMGLIIGFLTYVVKWLDSLRQGPWRKRKINDILRPDYGEQLDEQKYFISSKFTTTPPNNLDDPLEVERVESARRLLDHFVDKVLVEDNTTNRYFCILAGAGMGKTTWAVNLVTSYINHYKKDTLPFEIKLLSLARSNFAEELQMVEFPNKTILILDALDENAEASNDLHGFMQNLEHLIQNFRFVILTSRTQFFPTEDDEPKQTSILNLGKDKGTYIYHKMYISPFSQEDVQEFLRKKYKKSEHRKTAEKIVARCSSLATRPLLLSHIDDLIINNQSYSTISSIYQVLIDAWVKREVRFFKGREEVELCDKLYDFSLNFAVELFNDREQFTNMRMNRDKYIEFINRNNYTDYNFSGRSLINRDAYGTVKFSHKTFYEYFLAKAKFSNPSMDIPKKGYELAWEFYSEMVKEEFSKLYTNNKTKDLLDFTLCKNVDYDYRKLLGVYHFSGAYVSESILNKNTYASEWLEHSQLEVILINEYTNSTLNFLYSITNLRQVIIGRKGFHASKHLRKVVEILKSKKVEVKIFHGNIQYR